MDEKYFAVIEENGQLLVSELSACGDGYIAEQSQPADNIIFQDSENATLGIDKGIMGWGNFIDNTIHMNSAIIDIDSDVKDNMISRMGMNMK